MSFDTSSPEDYSEYLRCWQVYLHNIQDKQFSRLLAARLPLGIRVHVWPMVWPSVQDVFMGRKDSPKQGTANFVAAVQSVEKEMACWT